MDSERLVKLVMPWVVFVFSIQSIGMFASPASIATRHNPGLYRDSFTSRSTAGRVASLSVGSRSLGVCGAALSIYKLISSDLKSYSLYSACTIDQISKMIRTFVGTFIYNLQSRENGIRTGDGDAFVFLMLR